ncbi:MAG: hypothetical protein M3Z30_13325 [Gemmatimonadota bacterium]|nr:hypothetical protein [Gemmatimonadota bacterium]
MTRNGLLGYALAGITLSIAIPLSARAAAPGPTRLQTPSDTLAKVEKARSEKVAPAARKKLKPHATPTTSSTKPDFVPDQPWETDFYVDNDISGRHAIQLAIATFPSRR